MKTTTKTKKTSRTRREREASIRKTMAKKTRELATKKRQTRRELRERAREAGEGGRALLHQKLSRDELEKAVKVAEKEHAKRMKPYAKRSLAKETSARRAKSTTTLATSGVRIGERIVVTRVTDDDEVRTYKGTYKGQHDHSILVLTTKGKEKAFPIQLVGDGTITLHFPRLEKEAAKRAAHELKIANGKKIVKLIAEELPETEKRAKAKAATKPVKEAKPKKGVKPSELGAQLFADWRGGKSIIELVKTSGLRRGKLRRLLIAQAGGKAKFRELRDGGAGGTRSFFGRGQDGSAMNDDGVKTIKRARGWKGRTRYVNRGGPPLKDSLVGYLPLVSETVFISPKTGIEYVRAQGNEKADLIVDLTSQSLGKVRLRKFEGSALERRVEKEDKLVEHGKAAHKARRAKKTAAKRAKLSAKVEPTKPAKKVTRKPAGAKAKKTTKRAK